MKTLLNLTRSIITSFLFIILTLGIIVQFLFTVIRVQEGRISDLIDRESIYNLVVIDDSIKNNFIFKDLSMQYIDEYINYIFYKRSFPTMDLELLNTQPEEMQKNIIRNIDLLKGKIDLEYEMVVKIRNFNNFISNGSIYLLINIGLFVILLILIIVQNSFKFPLKLFGISLIIGALLSLITGTIISSILLNNDNKIIMHFSQNIINNTLTTQYFNLSLIYILIGFITFFIIYTYEKITKK